MAPSSTPGTPAPASALSTLIPPMSGPSGGFTRSVTSPASAVTGGISPRHPANADGKGGTPDGAGA